MGIAGKVALVTGGGQGIGRAAALALGEAGARVVVADADPEAGEEAAAELRSRGISCLAVPTDVSDSAAVRALVERTLHEFGALHILVNNAGIPGFGSLFDPEAEARWQRVLAVNLTGAFLCARHAAMPMREAGGGAIINISSTRAFQSEADSEPYAATKAGLLGLTHALAVSLGPQGIRVNAICPGWIETAAWKKASARREPELRPEDHAQHPVGRVGAPPDVAQAVLFLADAERSGFMTGQHLTVDGGMTVKMIYL